MAMHNGRVGIEDIPFFDCSQRRQWVQSYQEMANWVNFPNKSPE